MTSAPTDGAFRAVVRRLVTELSKFGVVGLGAVIVDVGLFNLLRFAGGEGPLHDWPLAAKVISSAVATVVSWTGNRYWTFRHARRSAAHREFWLFVLACTIGLGISLACLAFSHYVLDLTSQLADNISANVIGLGLGTLFRFWAYRTYVFNEDRSDGRTDDDVADGLDQVGPVSGAARRG